MLVYILNVKAKPIMPCKPSKARKLLKQGKARVIKREPFTIQLLFGSSGYKQKVTLGIDTGSKYIGLSASTISNELFSANIQLRNDISDLLTSRKQTRRARRNRLRYRKARFLNRVGTKNKGWLAPSIEHKIQTHLNIVEKVNKLIPISKTIVETANFDIQKLKNPMINSIEYQQGEQLGFWNVREYVLFRDNHLCQYCKGKSKDNILEIHHIVFKSHGGTDAPSNLITLCSKCHTSTNHKEGKVLWNWMIKGKKTNNFKNSSFMSIMRWSFYNRLKEIYPNVNMTYGYITKNIRITKNLPKEHYIDAYCIANNMDSKRLDNHFYMRKIRRHNRQIHKTNILKGGKKKLNQAQYNVKGFRLFDKVIYESIKCFIFGRRNTGYFDLRTIDNVKIHSCASYKKLKLITKRSGYILDEIRNI